MIRGNLAGTALLTLFLLGGCSKAAPAPEAGPSKSAIVTISNAIVAYDPASAAYSLDWDVDNHGAGVSIEVSSDPEAAPGEGSLLAEDVTATDFTWNGQGVPGRNYFLIIPEHGEPVRTALRVLPLEGGRNFRDLGGYQTEDGKTVKWGEVYRSGVMAGLTSADYDYLSSIGIKVVCDLRTAQERAAEPTSWQQFGAQEYLSFPDPEGAEQSSFMTVFRDPDVTPEKVSEAMAAGYAQIAHEQVPAYREMFDRLAAGDLPLAFNCSAGKDRTGIGAALILTALGVPRDTVVQDYALSEKVVDYMADYQKAAAGSDAAAEDNPYAFLASVPPELLAPLMRSDPRYIEAALSGLEQQYGSIDVFLRDEVEVSDEELASIRGRLLED